MRKFILPLATITVAVASSSGTVSCVKAGYSQGEIGERLMLITDSGRVTDKSFNQSSYETILKYSNSAEKVDSEGHIISGGFDFQDRGLSATKNYVEPLSADAFSLISAYKIAAVKGTDILVLPGFQHANTVNKAAELLGYDKSIVFADCAVGGSPNIINLVYNSQLAGFAAGFDAAVWATTLNADGKMQGATRGHDRIHFGTYGGISSKLAVDNYMWGFMVSISYFNKRIDQAAAKETDAEKKKVIENRKIYFSNVGATGDVDSIVNVSGTNTAYFTGSFEPGGSTKSGTNQLLYDDGQADLIFPVAGPQTSDTLAYAKQAYVIGVDTDQSFQYSRDANRFVTSALKNLGKSISDAIDHAKACRLNHHPDGTLMEKPLVGGEYWDGTQPEALLDWSVDVDQVASPNGSKIPHTLFNYADQKWKGFIDEMNDYFLNQLGSQIPDYMNGNAIKTMAQKILANDQYTEMMPLEFPQS